MPSAATLLQELIRIPSVNPEGEHGPAEYTGEKKIAHFIADCLESIGAKVELPEVKPDRPNVIGRFPSATPDKPQLLFAPHTDTVSVAGMTIDPFAGEIRDERIHGRGSSDTKGSIAAMLQALKNCREILPDLTHEIWFAGLMGEEAGLQGSRHLAENSHFDFVIVGEPTELQIVHATKGSAWLTLTFPGNAVHASTPDKGDNAIHKMSDVVHCIRNEIAPWFQELSHPALGSPTISVGTCRGGTKVNVVPDFCELGVDLRTLPGQEIEPVIERIRTACPDVGVSVWEARPMFTDPAHPIIDALTSDGARCTTAPWFCDAAVFGESGVPAVAVGPGSIAQAHTKDEFIAVADLDEGVAFFEKFLRKLAR